MLFSLTDNTLCDVKEVDFKNEKELQTLCKKNLKLLLNLEFIATEFSVIDLRMDTIAYDEISNSFVIIEYKNTKNSSVIDQGYTYLSTMFNHKADFVLEYNRVTGKMLGLNDIDWTQSKVIFISPTYTKYQMNSINFKDLPIELWKIKKYSNSTVLFEEIKPVGTTAQIKEIAPSFETSLVKSNTENIATYDEKHCTENASQNMLEIYEELRDFITDFDDSIKIKFNKHYVAFIYKNKNLISMKVQKNSIVMWIYADFNEIDNSSGLIEDVSEKGHHGSGNCQIKITDKSHFGTIQDILSKHFEDKK